MSFNEWKHKGKTYQLKRTEHNDCKGCAFDDGDYEHCPRNTDGLLCDEWWNVIWVEKTTAAPKQTEMLLPTNAAERKKIPIVSGVLDYFPLAIAEVAKCSMRGK